MSRTTTELHLTCCDCPHVNIVIAERGKVKGHFACDYEKAEAIAAQLQQLAAEARAKTVKLALALEKGALQ